MYFLRRKYNQKPRQWGPISAVRAAASNWFEKKGLEIRTSETLFFPFWEKGGDTAHNILGLPNADVHPGGSVVWGVDGGVRLTGGDYSSFEIPSFTWINNQFTCILRYKFLEAYTTNKMLIEFSAPAWQLPYGFYINYEGNNETWVSARPTDGTDNIARSNQIGYADDLNFHTVSVDNNRDRATTDNTHIYIDGDDQSSIYTSGGGAANYVTGQIFDIGSRYGDVENWNGVIDYLLFLPYSVEAVADGLIEYLYHNPYEALRPRSIPYYSFASGGTTDDLTANDLASGIPDLGTPIIGQTHGLSVSDLFSDTPNLQTPDIGQAHSLTVSDLVSGTPALGAPTLTEGINNLTVDNLTSGTPDLGTPSVGQAHELTANAFATGSPDIASPDISQIHDLIVGDLISGTPDLGTPALTEDTDNLTASNLTSGAPNLGTPDIGQTHALTVGDLASGTPDIGSPTLTENTDELTASNLTSGIPDLETPSIGQIHALTVGNLTSDAPNLQTPTVGHVHVLTAANITTQAPDLGAPTANHIHNLSVDNLAPGAPSLESPAIAQIHILTASGVSSRAPTIGSPSLDWAITNTPAIRISTLSAEDRTSTIAVESRTSTISFESRS